jgi:hypothetical protein
MNVLSNASYDILADGPVGYWRLDETSGSVAADSSGAGHDGTYGTGWTLNQTQAISNTAVLTHQTTNDYMSVPDHADFKPSTEITAEAWFLCTGLNGNQRIVQKSNSGDDGLRIYLNTNSTLFFQLRINNSNREISAGPGDWNRGRWNTAVDGTWHHVVGTFDGTYMRLYVDGALVATSVSYSGLTMNWTTDPISWGRKITGDSASDHFLGYLDELSYYDYALSGSQILDHWSQGELILGEGGRMVTSVFLEIAAYGVTTHHMVTSAMLEIAAEEFWHGFGTAEYSDEVSYISGDFGASNPGDSGFLIGMDQGTGKGHGRGKLEINPAGSGTDYRNSGDYRNTKQYRS